MTNEAHCNLKITSPIVPIMQVQEDLEPTVRIRELKTNSVDFVLGNVDLAWAQ